MPHQSAQTEKNAVKPGMFSAEKHGRSKRSVHDYPLSRRGAVALAGAGCSALALSGCGAAQPGDQGSAAGSSSRAASQVVIAMTHESEPAQGFNPVYAWGCGEHVHEPLIQSTLVTTDADMQIVGDLATEWLCSDDGLTWTFTLRDDVVFSDGEPLSAADVAFTINTVRSTAGSQADLSMVEDAAAVNDTTVEIQLAKPFNVLLYTLAVLGIVPEHAYDDNYGAHPVGSGRYVLAQWDQGQQAIFEANPHYYGEKPKMDRVVVVFMDEDAALAAARAGEVDVAYVNAPNAGQQIAGYVLTSYPTVDSRGIALPAVPAGETRTVEGDMAYEAGNDVTADEAVRRAINLAVDRQALIENVLGGYGKPAYSVCDGMPWGTDDMQVATDADAARALLDDAGWSLGEDGVREKDGTRAEVVLWYASSDSARQALANEFANQMAEIGIKVTLSGGSWDEIYARQYADLVMWGWGANSPNELYALTYSSSASNYACYESDVLDACEDQALAEGELEASYELWKKAQWDGEEGIAPQGAATWVWLANVDHLYFVREGLTIAEQKPHPHGHGWSLANNVDQWSWE